MKVYSSILLKLICIALNGRNNHISSSNTNWNVVLQLSQKQGVRGLAYEALELLKEEDADCTCFPDLTTLMQWYGQTLYVEKKIAQHVDLAKGVVELWKLNGIKTFVFKGLATAVIIQNQSIGSLVILTAT